MPVRKRRQKGLKVSNFALLLVVFNWHHGSEGVNPPLVSNSSPSTLNSAACNTANFSRMCQAKAILAWAFICNERANFILLCQAEHELVFARREQISVGCAKLMLSEHERVFAPRGHILFGFAKLKLSVRLLTMKIQTLRLKGYDCTIQLKVINPQSINILRSTSRSISRHERV